MKYRNLNMIFQVLEMVDEIACIFHEEDTYGQELQKYYYAQYVKFLEKDVNDEELTNFLPEFKSGYIAEPQIKDSQAWGFGYWLFEAKQYLESRVLPEEDAAIFNNNLSEIEGRL